MSRPRGSTASRGPGGDEGRGARDVRFAMLPTAAWFGLAAGLCELASLAVRVRAFEKGFFLRSRHFLWMVPVSVLAIFMGWGLVLALVARSGRRVAPRLAIGSFLFLACMSQFLLVRGLHAMTCSLLSAGIALRAARWIDGRRAGFHRGVRLSMPVLAVALATLFLAAMAREFGPRRRAAGPSPAPPGRAPNVLLIVLDTVRADRLGLYGHDRETAPNLARLAAEGVWFRRARSTAPWTLPSHASLFTGRWPHELLVESLGRLDARYPTLAEFLGDRGYTTGGFVANTFFCGHESGLSRGFDTYRDHPVTPGEVFRASSLGWFLARNLNRAREELLWAATAEGPARIGLDFPRKAASAVNREFLDWLDRVRGAPFFAFLNYFDAHDPYLPPERPARPFGLTPRSREQFAMLRDWQKLDRAALGPTSHTLARDAYDDCIASLDHDLGALLDDLRRRAVLDQTLLIVTADHGEQFGEHGAFGHGMSVYEPEVHVPLLVVFPGRVPRGMVVDQPVSLRDVPATVAELVGVAAGSPFPGRPLARTWDGTAPEDSRTPHVPLSELESPIDGPPGSGRHRGPSRSILAGSTAYHRHGDGSEELYDLDRDPGESRDLGGAEGEASLLARCRRLLGQLLDGDSTSDARGGAGESRREAWDPGDP